MSAVGSGSNPRTISQIHADRVAAGGGGGGGESPWRNGGRVKALIRSIPIATTMILLTNFAVYFYELSDDDVANKNTICVQPVIEGHEYARVFTNAWMHGGFFHIAMNMMALYQLGTAIETEMGTLTLLGQTTIFPIFIGGLYILYEEIAAAATKKESYLYTCALGYSGVLFAFLVIETSLNWQRGERSRRIFGFDIPIFFYPIILLLVISLVMPNISFAGHLSGLIVGILYTRGLLLPFTLPRRWLLAIQRCFPASLRESSRWKNVPDNDPFQSFYPAFCQQGADFCPEAPNMDNGCLAVSNMCLNVFRLFRGGGGGGGQASGVGAGGAGGGSGAGGMGRGGGQASGRANSRLVREVEQSQQRERVPSNATDTAPALNPLLSPAPPSPSSSGPTVMPGASSSSSGAKVGSIEFTNMGSGSSLLIDPDADNGTSMMDGSGGSGSGSSKHGGHYTKLQNNEDDNV